METINQNIYRLECSLLTDPVRRSYEKLDTLIANEFFEFASSGAIYSKADILEQLPQEGPRKFVVTDFKTTELASDIILATYKVTVDNKNSLRSSIWKLNNQGRWQIIFHQGTPC
jgi:hypothetical protein